MDLILFRRFLPHSIKRVVNGFTAHAIRIVNGKTEKKKDHPSRFQYLLLNSKKARPWQMYISKNSLLKNAVKGLAKDFSLITGIQHRTNNGEVIIFSIIAGNSGTKDARLNRKQKANAKSSIVNIHMVRHFVASIMSNTGLFAAISIPARNAKTVSYQVSDRFIIKHPPIYRLNAKVIRIHNAASGLVCATFVEILAET